ncbi:MAG: hypothetical protein AAB447_03230 [Patescibacteria group bacterium]
MKWILFTGTWRVTNAQVETDVRQAVQEIVERGDGVLTGGATGVDFFAMDEMLRINPTFSSLRVIIPAYLEDYITDYYTNWCIEPITKKDIEHLALLLRKIKNIQPTAIIEMPYRVITQTHYDMRNDEEVLQADGVCAFQVNDSSGTQYTIDKAKQTGIPILLHKKYTL